jgi:hypothetical protein
VLKLAGPIHPQLPGFVAINTPPAVTSGGFFGAKFSAAPIGKPDEGLLDSKRPDEISEGNFDRRLSLADKLNQQFHTRYANEIIRSCCV